MEKTTGTAPSRKKKKVSERIEKLDPNNNKNHKGNPLVKKRGKTVRDDGFEHRTSAESST